MTALLGGCMSLHVLAQDDYEVSSFAEHDLLNIHLAAVAGFPTQELKDAVHNTFGNMGIGLSAGVLVNPFGKKKPSPVFPGVNFDYLLYGVDKIPETAQHPKIRTTYNIYTIQGALRLMPFQEGGFVPYLDGMLGTRIFNTRSKAILDEPEQIHSTNDAGLNYVLGVGFYTRKPNEDKEDVTPSFTLRVLYYWGDDVKYVVRDSFTIDSDDVVHFDTDYTRTSMFMIQLGVMLH